MNSFFLQVENIYMYILAFDTTAAQCSIILQKDTQVIGRYLERMDFGQSEVLLPQIKNLLEANNLKFPQIDALMVCVGPGSFTGVRASIAAARTFKTACPQLKLDGISAFDCYVLGLKEVERAEINAVLIETKREDFYIQLFDKNLQKLTQPQAMSYDDILPLLRHKKISLIGDGVERFLSKNSGLSLHCIKMSEGLEVEDMITAGLLRLKEAKTDFPKPLYLRAPDVCLPKS